MYIRVNKTTIIITISWTKPLCSVYVYEVGRYTSREYCLNDNLANIYEAMDYVKNKLPKWLRHYEVAISGNKNTLYYIRYIPQRKEYAIRAKTTKNLYFDVKYFNTKEAAEKYLLDTFKGGLKNAKFL